MTLARTYESAERRWAGIGPYYAMFPTEFADRIISRYTEPGDAVLDPFAGRGTAVFSAAHQGRHGIGIEINPVGWVYAKTKLGPATKRSVEKRLRELGDLSQQYSEEARELPVFFKRCFTPQVRSFLLAARDDLDWRESRVDRTAAALLLVYLHGKKDAALSNQMRQTKSMAPDYAVRWWRERKMTPPRIDPIAFMIQRLNWRYAKGIPGTAESSVYLADSATLLSRLGEVVRGKGRERASLLFTSPPYFALTNYHYDQWLRLWLLGAPPNARRVPGTTELRGKFEHPERYEQLLRAVFAAAAERLSRNAVVYVRTGTDEVTHETTNRVLREVFPNKRSRSYQRPYSRPTQTSLFGDRREKAGEVDLVLYPTC
ncbi:MAG: DNA methyltransferase [Dehalococcoidia bacterium]